MAEEEAEAEAEAETEAEAELVTVVGNANESMDAYCWDMADSERMGFDSAGARRCLGVSLRRAENR